MSFSLSGTSFVGTQFFEQLNLLEEEAILNSKSRAVTELSENKLVQTLCKSPVYSVDQYRLKRKRKSSSPISPLLVDSTFWDTTPCSGKKRTKKVRSSLERRKSSTGSFQSPISSSTPIVSNNLRRQSLQHSFKIKLSIENWGLPDTVVEKYISLGVKELFPWQVECLVSTKALTGGNLIYSAPTSSGKTLVSELLLLKTVTESKKKGLYILPFVAVAREKARDLQFLTDQIGLHVESYAGSSGSSTTTFRTADIAVCTIEKANSLVNRLLEEGKLNQLGIVVVDELHLVGDPHRGYLLELLLTKIHYNSLRHSHTVQVVGMSATLPNIAMLCKWLKADMFCTDFRPVPLREYIKIGSRVLTTKFEIDRELQPSISINNDPDSVVYLCLETVLEGYSALVFCPTKAWCEKIAQQISSEFFSIGTGNGEAQLVSKLRENLNGQSLSEVIEKLRNSPAGLDSVLGQTLKTGVAFHHAGLTAEEREILEEYFKRNVVKVLVATSTLSSGVNLPARRVIVRTPLFHGTLIDPLVYKQMIGRAGRQGKDTQGESYLICQPNEKNMVERLLTAQPQPLKSCLLVTTGSNSGTEVSRSLKRALLEVIATGIALTLDDLKLYASCTLLAASADWPESLITSCVDWLVKNEFICKQANEECERIVPSQLGLACLASSLSPDEGLELLSELQNARRGMILENDLHLVYQVTPTYVSDQWSQIDWLHYLNLWESLSEDCKRVGAAVGVEERFLVRAMKGTVNAANARQNRQMAIHKRFYTALALNDLMNEIPLRRVVRTYKANKGMLQGLQQQTATFAGMVTVFCHRLGWTALHVLLENFQSRLQFGVQRELCDLMRLSSLDSRRARMLYSAGFTSVMSVAAASASNLELVLRNSSPFQSAKDAEENCLKQPIETVDTFLLVEEARRIIQKELGAKIEWTKQEPPVQKSLTEAKLSERREKDEITEANDPSNMPEHISELPDVIEPARNQTLDVIQTKTPEVIRGKGISAGFNERAEMPANLTALEIGIDGRKARNQRQVKANVIDTAKTPDNKPVKAKASVTPDLFEDSNSSVAEPTSQMVTPRTPNFAVCSEQLIVGSNAEESSVSLIEATPASSRKKRRSSTSKSEDSVFEATPELKPRRLRSFTKTPETLRIVDCRSDDDFEEFFRSWRKKNRFALLSVKRKTASGESTVAALAVSWRNAEVYVLELGQMNKIWKGELRSTVEFHSKEKSLCVVSDIKMAKDVSTALDVRLHDLEIRDVRLAEWMLDPCSQPKTVTQLGKVYGSSSSTTSLQSPNDWSRAYSDCSILLDVYGRLEVQLKELGLLESFEMVEMKTAAIVVDMELQGIAFNRHLCESIFKKLQSTAKDLESQAHRLVGYTFSLTSPKEVAKAVNSLNIQALLPRPAAKEAPAFSTFANPLKHKAGRGTSSRGAPKTELLKLQSFHPLPGVVLEHRKLTSILQKVVYPLLKTSPGIRIQGDCELRTATGRITMNQPNLQMIPRPFHLSTGQEINLRRAFEARRGCLLLSADYSQLELRILAHLCADESLGKILGSPNGDVFKQIAARWKNKAESEIVDCERQQAKQICYGIVYGIGTKTLAEQLEVDEAEAEEFAAAFRRTYPGIDRFVKKTIEECRRNGFVTTLLCRRRYLPDIRSSNAGRRGQAERQAVNSKIQGSAADLVKKAMILIDQARKEISTDSFCLVHQIHDELLYEVPCDKLAHYGRIIKHCMETAMPLDIRFPVNLKFGPSWGDLKPLEPCL